ncbi:MAG: NAD-dependent epimerase/dehydratase family protein, partial [Gemmataceae bacterium]|nr:NAD-dependent epimerase/dehydratase family protein [Gemmataceae bacterium]
MKCVVTGAAGFIGSHLCERLVADGHEVIGIDCFTDYYPRWIKEHNIAGLRPRRGFQLWEHDLSAGVPLELVQGAHWVFHLAAMPGLVRSWHDFDSYNRHNVTATHRLLEALRQVPTLQRLVYASTSSVYGRYASGDESMPTRPSSPYGLTKLAGEHLCRVYAEAFGLPVVILRYFSVYGPRQRPDMGYFQFVEALLTGGVIRLTGDGTQIRGNTYISDCVEATVRAATAMVGETFNVGGGELVSVAEVIRVLERLTGQRARLEYLPPRPGDQLATGADVGKLTRHTGWSPRTPLIEGLAHQVAWQRSLLQ